MQFESAGTDTVVGTLCVLTGLTTDVVVVVVVVSPLLLPPASVVVDVVVGVGAGD